MIAAAQAVAEAALRQAVARDASDSEVKTLLDPHAVDGPVSSLVHGADRTTMGVRTLMGADVPGEVTGTEQPNQSVVRDIIGYRMGGNGNMQSLLQLVTQQEHQQQLVVAAAAAEAAISSRPDLHYLTIARNGTILGATETVTGFPPNTLLMTSAYDGMYDEDIPGFLAVKTHFWDQGRMDVEAFHRRRTLEGKWLWLVSKVASYIDQPVPGFVLLESRVRDERFALCANRITRIASILTQAVEATRLVSSTEVKAGRGAAVSAACRPSPEVSSRPEEETPYNSLFQQASGKSKLASGNALDPLRFVMNGEATPEAVGPNHDSDVAAGTLGGYVFGGESGGRESFDPLAAMEVVRSGICLDMGMIRLFPKEVKLVTLVLTGQLAIEDLGPVVITALESPDGLALALDGYKTDHEEQTGFSITHGKGSAKRLRHEPQECVRTRKGYSFLGGENSRCAPCHYRCKPFARFPPPFLSVVNLSYTYMGNIGLEMLCEIIYVDNSALKTIDISFCGVDEKGILAFCRAISKRQRRGLPPLQGLVLSGNYISYRAAKDLGMALSPAVEKEAAFRKRSKLHIKNGGTGYEEDNESDDDDYFDDECEALDPSVFVKSEESESKEMDPSTGKPGTGACCKKGYGLQILHIGSASLSADALYQLLLGLGQHCPIRELGIPSNNIGPSGATMLVDFLEGKGTLKKHPVMPFLDRLDLSNNNFGNDGTARLTRAISKRIKVNLIDLRLSSNEIGANGIETIMNKLLQHNIVSLSLDKNTIGDQGCQLVAASLPSMHQLSRLNLSFNQIGSRGVNTLMRTLVGCESIRYLGLSGNIMKISGAIAMGFTLAQHPRLEDIDLDNCCLSQAAQCHIVAGMISNRWVPMKRMNGFQVGPPMVAIGALDVVAQHLSNDECFRLRRDEQMKTILQWMESNRAAKMNGRNAMDVCHSESENFLTPDFVSSMNDVHGTPSQSAYLRMLGWLSQIPFDEEELTSLRKYFYDVDGGEGDRGSDGYINLKLRGDLLAALASDVADEIRDAPPVFQIETGGAVGLDLDVCHQLDEPTLWNSLGALEPESSSPFPDCHSVGEPERRDALPSQTRSVSTPMSPGGSSSTRREAASTTLEDRETSIKGGDRDLKSPLIYSNGGVSSVSVHSKRCLPGNESDRNDSLKEDRRNFNTSMKPRITMFPPFEVKLEELKASAQDMMDQEDDPAQQDMILTQYAEASLTILRQLRYHCMNSGLDGWRQGGLRRKVLIVDDSKVTRKMVSRAFEKANFIVDTAENGVEGVEKLKESIYDIVFMDIDMPVMNGFEATKALRQWEDAMRPGARQPICALTAAYVDDFERSELMKFKEAGLDVMESKPCNIPRLFKVVDDVSPMFSDLSISVTQRETAPSREHNITNF